MNVEERKNFCLMTIALIQGVDRSLKQLIDAIHNDFGFVTQGYQNASAGLWRAWARDMKVVCVETQETPVPAVDIHFLDLLDYKGPLKVLYEKVLLWWFPG